MWWLIRIRLDTCTFSVGSGFRSWIGPIDFFTILNVKKTNFIKQILPHTTKMENFSIIFNSKIMRVCYLQVVCSIMVPQNEKPYPDPSNKSWIRNLSGLWF